MKHVEANKEGKRNPNKNTKQTIREARKSNRHTYFNTNNKVDRSTGPRRERLERSTKSKSPTARKDRRRVLAKWTEKPVGGGAVERRKRGSGGIGRQVLTSAIDIAVLEVSTRLRSGRKQRQILRKGP